MASVTAEVMLNFGVSLSDPGGKDFALSVDRIRFSMEGKELPSSAIIDILRPIWDVAYDEGYDDGYDQCNDGG